MALSQGNDSRGRPDTKKVMADTNCHWVNKPNTRLRAYVIRMGPKKLTKPTISLKTLLVIIMTNNVDIIQDQQI